MVKTYALIVISTVTDTGKRHDFEEGTEPDVSRKDRKWVLFTPRGDAPVYDPETEHPPLAGADQVSLTAVTQTWNAPVALTGQELTDRTNDARGNVTSEVDATITERGENGVRVRALIELLNRRDNYLVNRIEELQNALIALQASVGTPATRLDSLPSSYLSTETRNKTEAITTYKGIVNSGDVDS
ncbi:MAG: hypothetical protein DWQ49_09530 [Bacteroidetes bacterium]|mgnify:CR=1 FL=1|nr:MAG: hypothetical protein DWQ49_09530 [Bacteroidota bacterium]